MGVLLKYPWATIRLRGQTEEVSCEFHALSLQKSLKQGQKPVATLALKQSKSIQTQTSPSLRVMGCVLAIVIHAAIIYLIFRAHPAPQLQPISLKPISVSIISQPAPEVKPLPEIVPIVKSVVVVKNPVIKPKKNVEKILPVESPAQLVFEAGTEKVEQKEAQIEEMAVPAVEKSVEKSVLLEEKVELPKFSVAYLNNPAPEYPKMSKRVGEEGRVLLKVLVSVQGLPETVDLEKSSGYERLDHAAIEAVSHWKFVPARKGGQTLSAYVMVPIKFSLDD